MPLNFTLPIKIRKSDFMRLPSDQRRRTEADGIQVISVINGTRMFVSAVIID